jgi:hypothetical protein
MDSNRQVTSPRLVRGADRQRTSKSSPRNWFGRSPSQTLRAAEFSHDLITAKTYYKTQGMASIMRHDAPVDPSSWLVRRISRRRNPPHHLEPRADYAALIRPTRPTRPTWPCRLTPPSPRLLVTGSNPQFTSRRAFGPPPVLDLGQNGISARGAVSYRVSILSRTATHRYGIAP